MALLSRWLSRSDTNSEAPNAALLERLSTLTREQDRLRHEIACRKIVTSVLARYFFRHERTADIAIDFDSVQIDSREEWMPYVLERKDLTEPEFTVFRFFVGHSGTVLDIGANYGYSAATIWAAGCTLPILSFEPNPWHRVCLQAIKTARPGEYDFLITGLGAEPGKIRFVMPVIEGVGISGLSSAAIETELDWAIPENLVQYTVNQHPDVPSPRIQFAETQWDIAPLDSVLETAKVTVPLEEIRAMKIDVEGFEPEVITGATRTLRRHTPLLMIEGANRVPRVMQALSALGYRYGDFYDNAVALSDSPSSRVSGFYLHESRLDEYRKLGLLLN